MQIHRKDSTRPSKDVSIPEIYLPAGTTDGLLNGPSSSHRPTLVFFAGGIHGYIRTVLFEHWENPGRRRRSDSPVPSELQDVEKEQVLHLS